MVEVKNLVKRYGDKLAVNNVSFSVDNGEILGFLGPNGAGKSTTMNIITGYLSSTSGTVTIDGCEILDDPIGAKSKIGYLPEIPPLYLDMTVIAYLNFMFELKGVKLPKEEHIKEILTVAKIADVKDRVIKNLSKGYKQRVGVAQALLGNPPVLILDEPTVGLDPKQILEIRSLIKGLGKKHTVILSSHILSEVQAICDRVIVIDQGKLVADALTNELSGAIMGEHKILLHIEGRDSSVQNALKEVNGVSRVTKVRPIEDGVWEYIVESDKESDVRRAIFNAMSKNGTPIILMKSAEMSLEDAFLQLTSGQSAFSAKGGRK